MKFFFLKYNIGNGTLELQSKWFGLCWSSYVQGFYDKSDVAAHTEMTEGICISGNLPERSSHSEQRSLMTSDKVGSQVPSHLKWSKTAKEPELWLTVITWGTKWELVCGSAPLQWGATNRVVIYLGRGPTGWVWHGRAPSGDSSAGPGGIRTPRCSSPCLQPQARKNKQTFSHVHRPQSYFTSGVAM